VSINDCWRRRAFRDLPNDLGSICTHVYRAWIGFPRHWVDNSWLCRIYSALAMNEDHLDLDLDKLIELKSEYESKHADTETTISRLKLRRDGFQRLIEGLDRLIASEGNSSRHHGSAVRVPPRAGYGTDHTSSQESIPATNGLPENPTRRQVVMQIIPSFHGNRFKSGDVRHSFVQDYLGGVEPPNFPQAINNLLKRMAEKGEILDLGRDNSERGSPRYYQETRDHEGNLLEP
jgi:hypothetical protein